MVAQGYIQNLSINEFLFMAFTLMKRKVERIYELAIKSNLSLDEITKKHEMSSQVLESLRLLQGSLDPQGKYYSEQMENYNSLQLLLFKGNNEDPSYLKVFLSLLPKN